MRKSFIFAIFILIFSGIACKLPDFVSKSESNSNSISTQKESSVKASSNPRDDVIKASKKFTEQNSFQATMDMVGSKNMRMEISYVAPDRYHIKNSPAMEIIVVGKDNYMKMNDVWKKIPGNLSDSIPKMRDAFTEEGMKSLADVEYVGEDSADGKNALLYRYKGNTIKDPQAYASKLWIGKDNGLPLKMEVEYPKGGVLKKMTTNYDYDTKVTIEVPTGK